MAEQTQAGGGSSFMDPLKGFLLTYFMPESCYDQFFLNFNFLDGKRRAGLKWREFRSVRYWRWRQLCRCVTVTSRWGGKKWSIHWMNTLGSVKRSYSVSLNTSQSVTQSCLITAGYTHYNLTADMKYYSTLPVIWVSVASWKQVFIFNTDWENRLCVTADTETGLCTIKSTFSWSIWNMSCQGQIKKKKKWVWYLI